VIIAQGMVAAASLLGGAVLANRSIWMGLYAATSGIALPVADIILLGLMLGAKRKEPTRQTADLFN
jgi:hypothetical protein